MAVVTTMLNEQAQRFSQILLGKQARTTQRDAGMSGLFLLIKRVARMNRKLAQITEDWARYDQDYRQDLIQAAEDSLARDDTDYLLDISGEAPRIVLRILTKSAIWLTRGNPSTVFLPEKPKTLKASQYIRLVVLVDATANFVNSILDASDIHNGVDEELGARVQESFSSPYPPPPSTGT